VSGGFKIISRYDEALDALAMGEEGIARYRESADFSAVRIREGMTPTIFHCRRLRVSEMQAVRSCTSDAAAYTAAFARGVEKVEALRILDEGDDKKRREWVRPDATRPLSMSELDEVFSAGDVFEVGSAIMGRSILGKGRPAAWPLPATSHIAVQGLVHRLAAQTREADAASARTKSELAAPPLEQETTDGNG
jgi:hypothetical protein